jgi:uncharacterized membrane protein YfcA
VDQWLRDAMSGSTPRLSAAFDARLERRLRPRRLTATGRLVMAAYVLAALLVSLWALRNAALDWSLVAVLLPCAVIADVYGRRIQGHAR